METITYAVQTGGLLSYDSHSGLTDQLRQLALAHAVADVLGRHLVLPPLLRHFDATALNASRGTPRFVRTRSRLSSLLALSGADVPTIEAADLPVTAHDLPQCSDDLHAGRPPELCVRMHEPPEYMHGAVAEALRHLASEASVPWIHFRSMLYVHSARGCQRVRIGCGVSH